jgi:hypothetical protein
VGGGVCGIDALDPLAELTVDRNRRAHVESEGGREWGVEYMTGRSQ